VNLVHRSIATALLLAAAGSICYAQLEGSKPDTQASITLFPPFRMPRLQSSATPAWSGGARPASACSSTGASTPFRRDVEGPAHHPHR